MQNNPESKEIKLKQVKLIPNPKFASDKTIQPRLLKYLDKILDKSLLRYGLSYFSAQFVFGQQYKQTLNKLYQISLNKIGKSPNTMHKYGSGDIISQKYFNELRQCLDQYLKIIFRIEQSKKCYLFTDFSVHYGKDFDKKLDQHVDDADITINICLKNKNNFTGLRFNQIIDTYFSVKNTNKQIFVSMNQGEILIHSGKQRHQVIKPSEFQFISENQHQHQRVNLIIWLKYGNNI